MNNLIDLIKKSGAVREFTDQDIPEEILDKIIEAGRWGLSVLGIQPWVFIPIKNKEMIFKISDIVLKKSEDMADGANIVLRVTSKIIKSSKVIIAVYNSRKIEERAQKLGELYVKRGYVAEIQAIGGAIQNMILQTNELGLGCVWLDAPTFCSEEINSALSENSELVAFLAVGYPAVKAIRSKRHENNVVKRFI